MRTLYVFLLVTLIGIAQAQIRQFPFRENFDTVLLPALPAGWVTTSNRSAAGDFVTTHSVPFSESTAVVSTNATLSQTLAAPVLDFTDREPDSLTFYERRSASHNSGLLVEASTDGGASFGIRIGDTLKNAGVTSYVPRTYRLPEILVGQTSVRIRWNILGDGTGSTGTIRFDDVVISARAAFDAAVTGLVFFPAIPRAGDSVGVRATIRNAGTSAIGNLKVDFYADANADSLPGIEELFGSPVSDRALQPGETLAVESTLRNLTNGDRTIIAVVRLPGDRNASNDLLRKTLSVAFARATLIVNEIMYDPLPGNCEYAELLNRSPVPVDLHGWSIYDAGGVGGSAHVIARSAFVIGPGEYAVIGSDSSLFSRFPYLASEFSHVAIKPGAFSLNNSGDEVRVTDATGTTIDSVHYLPGWQNPNLDDPGGRSLERINPGLAGNDPRNWSTSASPLGGTPGRTNTLFTPAPAPGGSISFSPNPFSPDGDGFEDATIMSYSIPARSAVIRARVFDSRGRLIRILADGEPSGPKGELIWDGFDDDRRKAGIGIYVVFLEARDSDGRTLDAVKGVVVVAAKL
ncbi:MAG TPA: lamin tail domain-containing protein [Bacteroidota bacterium]|jgi:hypothetical protein